MLRLEPLYAACAGCLCLFVPPDSLDAVLGGLRSHPRGRDAAVVGTVTDGAPGAVLLRDARGGLRPLPDPAGPLPARLH